MKAIRLICCLFIITIKAENLLEKYSPNFDTSLGVKDEYYAPFYQQMINHLQTKNSSWSKLGINSAPLRRYINFCRNLYAKNKIDKIALGVKPKIPLIVHQIWLGSPLPKFYLQWQKAWQSIPGWEYKLWTDADVEKISFRNRDLYLQSKNYGQRADILRMEILSQYGGLYVDMDFECLDPEFFNKLHHAYDFYAGLHPLDGKSFGLNNGLIGSIKNHPIINGCIEELRKTWKQDMGKGHVGEIVIKTGPGLFNKMFFKFANLGQKNIALPPTFFYPLGLKHAAYYNNKSPEFLKTKICRPESVAIHWWVGSWHSHNAQVKK